MPSKSKSKGNKFENDVVKILNKTFNTEEFSRTPNSGAMMGRSNWGKKQGLSEDVKRTLGSDLITPEWFKFSVECKHYKDSPNYSQIIQGPDSTLDHWLAECVFDAINLDLHPLLFFKTNRKGTFFALPYYFLSSLDGDYLLRYRSFHISGIDHFIDASKRLIDFTKTQHSVNRREVFFSSEQTKNLLKVLDEKQK